MKKVALIVVGVLALAGSANAQGKWYTNQAKWQSLVTNVRTATYTTVPSGSSPWTENGVTAALGSGLWNTDIPGSLSTREFTPVTFTFSGNAFGGMFALTDIMDSIVQSDLTFSIDGSQTNVYNFISPSGYTFVGYISDSASDISVEVSGSLQDKVAVNSFSRANGTNPADPGASVAPEPGTLALALTGGCALVGMVIRRRKTA